MRWDVFHINICKHLQKVMDFLWNHPLQSRRSMKLDVFFSCLTDNNECISGTHHCHSNATCNNTDGSFTCACDIGYNGDGVTCQGRQKLSVVDNYYFID